MYKPIKYVEKGLTLAARGAWTVFDTLNSIAPAQAFTPKWSEKPILKSWQKVKPPLGWPRETDSLCPKCVREARQEILDGKRDYKILLNEKVGEIKAQIIERDGKILMIKDCPQHGHFEDVMAIDPAFFKHLERVVSGQRHPLARRREAPQPRIEHHQVWPRSRLTIDLTNRCNMMCDPCFMDANQVGFVHELSWEDIKTLLDQCDFDQAEAPDVGAVLGRRADDVAVLPGCGALLEESWLQQCPGGDQRDRVRKEPGVRPCGSRSRSALRVPPVRWHRQRRQLPSPWSATSSTSSCARSRTFTPPASTSSRSRHRQRVNNEQVGRISSSPSITRGRSISSLSSRFRSLDATRKLPTSVEAAQRYTLSHLAHDVKSQVGIGEPVPRLVPDLVHGNVHRLGRPRARSQCGVGQPRLRLPPELRHRHGGHDRQGTKEAVPVTAFLKAGQVAEDLKKVNDAGRGKFLSSLGMALVLMKNYDPFAAPTHFKLMESAEEVRQDVRRDRRDYGKVRSGPHEADIDRRRADRWNFLFIAGMWFQDLFNYDFRRTERCIIPYATQEGEISSAPTTPESAGATSSRRCI
jgi:hypothetical protein